MKEATCIIRISERDKEELKHQANSKQMTMSEYILYLIHREEAATWARDQVRNDEQNLEELRAERKKAWEAGDRQTYNKITSDIRDIKHDIENVKDSYLS